MAKLPLSLDYDCLHSDDIQDDGRALNAVRYITVDRSAVEARNIALIQERIAKTNPKE